MSVLGAVGYAAACAAWLVLAGLLATALRQDETRNARRLLFAVGISAAEAFTLALQSAAIHVPGWLVVGMELGRSAAWVYVLLSIAPAALPRFLAPVAWTVFGTWALACIVLRPLESAVAMGGFAVALLTLLLVEQLYRNSDASAQRGLKFLAIGIGGLATYDLFLYAQGLLLGGLDGVSWFARGIVNAMLVPFIALGARRLPDSALRVFVSRQATFYTTTFLAAGVYLLVMSAAGYAIRQVGGGWGELARGTFLVGAFAVLVVLVTSAAMRRRLRVFLSKHFYENKYDYRVEWLRFSKMLSDSEPRDVHRAGVHAVAQVFDSPGGLLFIREESGRRFVAVAGWPLAPAELTSVAPVAGEDDMLVFMRERRWIIDLQERTRNPKRYDGMSVPAWIDADQRLRLVSPIFRLDELVGFFVLFDPPPPFELAFEDRDLLHMMGEHVATLLAQHDADRRIAELSQFETYNRLTAFVMHDLKNCAAQLSLVVGNAVKHRQNPEFIDDAIATIANTSERILRLIEHLSRRSNEASLHTPVRLAEVVTLAVDRCRARRPSPRFENGSDSNCMVAAEREQLAAAIEHVLRNAQDATTESGSVSVDVAGVGNHVRLTVRDDGVGMEPEFVQHQLFRPFHSTKGSKGMGIGAYQARELARSLGGDVEVESRPGAGTQFSFVLPVAS
jgi:putative PEP-CTERM system histidine kinase